MTMSRRKQRAARRERTPFRSRFMLIILAAFHLQCALSAPENECASDGNCAVTEDWNWLAESGVAQDMGVGKAPDEIVQQIKDVVIAMNKYFLQFRSENVVHACTNQQNLCALWVVTGQCTNSEYQRYMAKECPLACQTCGSDIERGRAFIRYLSTNLTETYYTGDRGFSIEADASERNMLQSRSRTLSKLLRDLQMDAELLDRQCRSHDGNWLLELHTRIMAMIPTVLLAITDGSSPNPNSEDDEEVQKALHIDQNQMSVSYRGRGSVLEIMVELFDHLVIRPIQLKISFAIPNGEAIKAIRQLDMPVLEMGAGSGYWHCQLQAAGISVQSFDVDTGKSSNNKFFDHFFTMEIQEGACVDILQSRPQLAQSHALLLVWPNDPDPQDNPQFCSADSECIGSLVVWDADCLEEYIRAGGKWVIYVGEREQVLRARYPMASSPDCGLSSTRRFQQTLQEKFTLKQRVLLPSMWLNEDDLTIWQLT